MQKPKISIITPTRDREHLLPAISECVKRQTISEIEWLIHDGSQDPSPSITDLMGTDDRIRYFHEPHATTPLSIGAKRNLLVQEAVGETIIHFDDDDYYASGYVEGMLTLMQNEKADIVKLFGFHLYHQKSASYAYWDVAHGFPLHILMHPHHADLSMAPHTTNKDDEWGYGCTYVYKKDVWKAYPFPDENHNEDRSFALAAIANLTGAGMQDDKYLMIHVIHESNTSASYPQQLLTVDFGRTYFPEFVPPLPSGP